MIFFWHKVRKKYKKYDIIGDDKFDDEQYRIGYGYCIDPFDGFYDPYSFNMSNKVRKLNKKHYRFDQHVFKKTTKT